MLIKAVLLGVLTVTSYRPVAWQTKPECISRNHCRTATDENVSELGIAVSQDYIQSGEIHFGDVLYVDGVGYRIVDDVMASRIHHSVDVFVYTRSEERKIGVRHCKVYLIKGANNDLQKLSQSE